MAFNLQNKIFDLFPAYDNLTDINKNSLGKGTLQRYNESLGLDFDTNLYPLIDELYQNTQLPYTLLLKYLSYASTQKGVNLNLGNTEEIRRRVYKYFMRWVQIKGTIRCVELFYTMLGYTNIVITESFSTFGFDSSVTFDSPERTFDSGCNNVCGLMSIALEGTATLTDNDKVIIFDVINWNLPIHGILSEITYNSTPITI